MRRLLIARFNQRPPHLPQLLALRYPVKCKAVPDDLIEKVAAELNAEATERLHSPPLPWLGKKIIFTNENDSRLQSLHGLTLHQRPAHTAQLPCRP